MTRYWALLSIAVVLAGCGGKERSAAPEAARKTAPQVDSRPVIVAFGDSLTAGLGLEQGQTYPDVLQQELDGKGYSYRIVNQGISGDTTDGGLARIDSAIAMRPAVVILELGANDGLRGLPLDASRANLAAMIDAFQRSGAKVLLCGMTLPRNYGPAYISGFERVFQDLSREKKVRLIPFFLEGVATSKGLMQSDGLHPNAAGAATVAKTVMRYLEPLLAPA